MNEEKTSHIFDEIETYLAGGLPAPERLAFESHVASCPPCAAALDAARENDAQLRELFRGAHPAPGFEDKMIQKLRIAPRPKLRLLNPMAIRSAAAIAAAVMLAGTGVAVSKVLDGGGSNSSLVSDFLVDGTTELAPSGVAGERGSEQSFGRTGVDRVLLRRKAGMPDTTTGRDVAEQHALRGFKTRLGPPERYDTVKSPEFGLSLGDAEQKQKPLLSTEALASRSLGTTNLAAGGTVDLNGSANVTHYFEEGKTNNYAFRPAEQLGVLGRKDADGDGIADSGAAIAGKPSQAAVTFGGGVLQQQAREPSLVRESIITANTTANGTVPQAWGLQTPATPGLVTNATLEPGQALAEPPAAPPVAQPAPGTPSAPPAADPNPANPSPAAGRKIIRNGTMEFEVQSFDDALIRVTKLVVEQGGFIATTDSDKLPNGKMRGTVTVRVPPEHLDTLSLTLRGIGDLKSQKITAEDVTKHYTDLESQLRAAQAMYDRLIQIVKEGKGQIKDLVAAEKELGVWEEKIEQIKGEQRYLDNLIGYSTLALVLYEKDIKTPASVSESEQVMMSLETEKVDDDYNKAIDAIKEARGRIIQSELKQYDAGQLGGTIQAAIPPDAAEQVIARLRQLDGRIAHFSRDRNQKMQAGEVASAATPRINREDLVLSMQIYNLANIAPRRTTTLQLAAAAVDHAYQQVIEQVRSAGGRIVTSSLAKPDPNTQVADLDFQVPSDKADLLLETVRGYGEAMRQDATENPDTANVTEAKRGFHVRIVSLSAVPARETQTLQLAAASVSQAFADILTAVKGVDGRVFQSDLNEQNTQDVTGAITVEIPRAAAAAVNATIGKSAQVLSRAVNRSADVENTVDTKIRIALTLSSGDHLPPRQVTTVREEVSDVERSVDDLLNAAVTAGGRRIGNGDISPDRAGHVTAQVVVDVPLASANSVLDTLEKMGYRRSKQVAFDSTVPDGPLARARIDATFSNSSASLGGEETTWDALRHGLATSAHGLRWSLQMLVIGLCFVAPWVIALWILIRLIRRSRATTPKPAAVPA